MEIGGQILKVTKVTIHPQWNGSDTKYYNDIALLKLASPVTVTSAKVIALPIEGMLIPNGANISVTGWGITNSTTGSRPDILQEVEVPTIDNNRCKQLYDKISQSIINSMFCAIVDGAGGKDACAGDSGSPAVYDNQVVGVVSWGIGCGLREYRGFIHG